MTSRPAAAWLCLLAGVLTGYAALGKGFSYLGAGPVRVGEVLVLAALPALALAGASAWRRVAREPAAWMLALFMAAGALRLLPDLGLGIPALRDAAVWGYGVVAIAVAVLATAAGDASGRLGAFLRVHGPVVLLLAPVAFFIGRYGEGWLPAWPGAGVPVIWHKPGDILVHLGIVAAGAVVAMPHLAGRAPWALPWAVGLVLIMPFNRAGMLACAAACLAAWVLRPFSGWWLRAMAVLAVLVLLLASTGLRIAPPDYNGREVSFAQLEANLRSLLPGAPPAADGGGPAPAGNLHATATWRRDWWGRIAGAAVDGGPAWQGYGYGTSLRDATGFLVAPEDVRSPHSVHMTILGRAGWTGLALWGVLLAAWGAGMAAAWRRCGPGSPLRPWLGTVAAAAAAILVNGFFDVFIEGPAGGIWFWAVIGMGIALMVAAREAAPAPAGPPASRRIAGIRVDATSYDAAATAVVGWSGDGRGRYVCAANVHMAMEAWDDPSFARVVDGAALVCPDGVPLVVGLRAMEVPGQRRVYGPTLMLEICARAAAAEVPIGLYGGTDDCLDALSAALLRRFPGLRIAYRHAPPFRPLDPAEDAAVVGAIRASGARILFVGLGCPKQERWMADHMDRLPIVQVGVGAAFAFHAGQVAQAPRWMQALALEWLFRLAVEPRRLWRRYAVHNPRFVVIAGWQILLGGRQGPRPERRP